MCGIAGILALKEEGKPLLKNIDEAVKQLRQRGPDSKGTWLHKNLAFGHTRLKVIDTSKRGNQPMSAKNERYTIVYNGEFYNYREHREILQKEGTRFISETDTEVLLRLYIREGPRFLEKVNGFFAMAIYDKKEDTLFIARDRMGIKPLLVYQDENVLAFASEMKALVALGIPKKLDTVSLFTYLQLNYIPGPASIFHDVKKLSPGSYMLVKNAHGKIRQIEEEKYYSIPYSPDRILQSAPATYEEAQKKLVQLVSESVERRMVADVPLGCFLSGGVDSSIIATVAAGKTDKLATFSIGYKDEPFFDETKYAKMVAKKCGARHTIFSLTNNDLFENLHNVLDYIDEPFADSSALAVNILSMYTRKHVTVALSGDGADELFSGYNKHYAEFKARNPGVAESIIKGASPLLGILPQSRNSKLGNLSRQLSRFALGMKLSNADRYWRWAGYLDEEQANYLLKEPMIKKQQRLSDNAYEYKKRKDELLKAIKKDGDLNDVFFADMMLVLPYDMLHKVDSMSMAHSLEVRTPFLDHHIVDFAFTLPVAFKVNSAMKKKILQDAFAPQLPEELYNRPKQGFEVPLLKWFQTELKSLITDDLLEKQFIIEQGIFNFEAVKQLQQRLFSNNTGDAAATTWALVVFQHWWKKYMC